MQILLKMVSVKMMHFSIDMYEFHQECEQSDELYIIAEDRQMYQSEKGHEEYMPELVALQKRTSSNQPKSTRNLQEETFRFKPEEGSKVQAESAAQQSATKQIQSDRPATNKAEDKRKYRQSDLRKRNEISKNLINEMINKISVKSITEENYPISNETIERLMLELDAQIAVQSQEVAKFQHSLSLNPTNQHLKKELQVLEKNLNQIRTIRELYIEKSDNRNKISDLQSKIMQLKAENRQLKIKISRGIQKIQSHIHNLPCEREKELIEQVNKYKLSLNREKEMRQNLQNNISSVVFNFKRFYEEADDARKIVTLQLRTIDAKQHELNSKLENLNHHKCDGKTPVSFNLDQKGKGDSHLGSSGVFMRQRKLTNRFAEEQNIGEVGNKGRMEGRSELEQIKKIKNKDSSSIPVNQLGSTIMRQDTDTKQGKFSLQDQIEKMRKNQVHFSKLTKQKQ